MGSFSVKLLIEASSLGAAPDKSIVEGYSVIMCQALTGLHVHPPNSIGSTYSHASLCVVHITDVLVEKLALALLSQ